MTIYTLSYHNKEYNWSENQLARRLERLGSLENRKAVWIRRDLSLCRSNWLTRLIWKVAKHFAFLRKNLFGVDMEESRSLLNQIGKQIKDNKNLFSLFTKALGKFNGAAPRHKLHGFTPDQEVGSDEPKRDMKEASAVPASQREPQHPDPEPLKKKNHRSIPEFIKTVVGKYNLTAQQIFQLIEKIYKDKGAKLSDKQKWAIKWLAQQHIDGKAPKIMEAEFSAKPSLSMHLKAASELLQASSFTEITRDTLGKILSEAHFKSSPTDSPGRVPGYNVTEPLEHRDFKTILSRKHSAPHAAVFHKGSQIITVAVRGAAEFWLFSSSGHKGSGNAYVERFFSLEKTVDALHGTFPYVDPTDLGYYEGSEKDLELNGFKAYILANT